MLIIPWYAFHEIAKDFHVATVWLLCGYCVTAVLRIVDAYAANVNDGKAHACPHAQTHALHKHLFTKRTHKHLFTEHVSACLTRMMKSLPIVSETNAPLQTCHLSPSYPRLPHNQCWGRLPLKTLTKRNVFSHRLHS